MELVVVTPPDYFEGEGQLINALFTAGLDLLHLRKPENDEEKFRKLMLAIRPEYYPAVSIHQHHELADEFSVKRLHYTEQHRKLMGDACLDELRGQGFCLSSSVHDLEEVPRSGLCFLRPCIRQYFQNRLQQRAGHRFCAAIAYGEDLCHRRCEGWSAGTTESHEF